MDAVKKDFPRATQSELMAMSLEVDCQMPEARKAMEEICGTYDRIGHFRALAAATLGMTLFVLLGTHWVGQRCRRDRRMLLNSFEAGRYLMTGVTLTLVISQALLLVATLYYGPAEFSNRIPAELIGAVCIGALLAIYQIVRLLFVFGTDAPMELDGRLLSAGQATELWEFVKKTAASIGTDPPVNIVAGSDPTFFVTESRVKTGHEVAVGRTLFISIPLCHILEKDELRSIIGHEMAHFHGGDTEFSRSFYPIFSHEVRTLEAVSSTAGSVGGGGYALLPAIWLLSFYLESFSEAEAEIGREREIAADSAGAGITSNRIFALALTKIIQHDPAWTKVYAEILDGEANDDSRHKFPSRLFQEKAEQDFRSAKRAEQIAHLESERLSHPTDSHPPLQERLKALGLTVAEVYDSAGDIHPAEPSSLMIPDADALERELFPAFAPKDKEVQTIFSRRQAGFAAMEYYAGILNRSFLIYVCPQGLYGIKFRGLVASDEPKYYESALELLDDPWFMPGTELFKKSLSESRANFFIARRDIEDVTFDSSSKWGMGRIPHAGKLNVRTKSGKVRQFILLGHAYGDGIRRYILDCGINAPGNPTG